MKVAGKVHGWHRIEGAFNIRIAIPRLLMLEFWWGMGGWWFYFGSPFWTLVITVRD